jgi:hypothetical protein
LDDDGAGVAREALIMQEVDQSSRRILVIADSACPCPGLADEVARRALATPSEVVVVAPALNSRLRHLLSDVDPAVARAQRQVGLAIDELSDRGVPASGTVGDSDPMMAIEDALSDFTPTEIIIATHPPAQSHWLERGLVQKAKTRFEVPVVEYVLDD